MTDDLTWRNTTEWSWPALEPVGEARSAPAAVNADGELAVVYEAPDHSIRFSRRVDNDWQEEATPLDSEHTGGGFAADFDLAYCAGRYFVCAQGGSTPHGLWGALRTDAAWEVFPIDGEGQAAEGRDCRAALSETQLAVCYDEGYTPTDEQVAYRDIAGQSWTTILLNTYSTNDTAHSLLFDGLDLCVLSLDRGNHDLLFSRRSAGFAQHDVAGADTELGEACALQFFNGELCTPAFDPVPGTGNLYLLSSANGSGLWSSALVAQGVEDNSYWSAALFAPFGTRAYALYMSAAAEQLQLGIFDGSGWSSVPVQLPSVDIYSTTGIELQVLGDQPCLLFNFNYYLFCAVGAPPAA